MAFIQAGEITITSDKEVEWTIDNFSYTEMNTNYRSKEFSISDMKWCLHCYINKKNVISFCLISLQYEPVSQVAASFTFGVKKADGKTEKIGHENTWLFQKDGRVYGFLPRSEVERRKHELSPTGVFTLTCTIRTWKHLESSSDLDTLSRNFADFFISRRGCDATLKVKGEEIPVHRFVLSARSSVFASMFEVDMKEKTTGTVDIEDCDPKTFREFLLYLYSGKIENAPSNAFELYKIADKYDVGGLKQYCHLSILSNLSMENFLDAFMFARQFSIIEIMYKSHLIFHENFTKIVKTVKWENFLKDNPSEANKLLQNLADNLEDNK